MFSASKQWSTRRAVLVATAMVAGAHDLSPAKDIRVAEGLSVERVAAAPLVRFPMFAALDDRGRLYVAESSGLDLYAELKNQTRKCQVRRLTDRDGDGRYETAETFVDKLVFPMGLAWRDGTLYVADPPSLITVRDTNGDGRADERKKILGEFGHIDNGSLHGLIFGPDGWLYMTMGSPDGFRIERPGKEPLTGTCGALLRCRPDGSRAEVLSRGFVNLIEVDFSPTGVVVGTNNWHQQPTAGMRDSLLHLVPGGIYPQLPADGSPRMVATGEPLPALALYPAVALSGLTRLRTAALGRDYENSFVSAQFNARRVVRHRLEAEGSTFRAEDSTLLSSGDPHFRPSDVIEDADGSLLVIDTGGWYVQHCPTNRIAEAQVPGGIYRVRRPGAARVADPWGLAIEYSKLSVEDLIERLGDSRVAVREKAGAELSSRGAAGALPCGSRLNEGGVVAALGRLVMSDGAPVAARVHAVWALSRIDGEEASGALRAAIRSGSAAVAVTAARAIAGRADAAAEHDLCTLLGINYPLPLRLAAAEALANCATARATSVIAAALAEDIDRHLEHCLVLALHRAAGTDDLRGLLDHHSPRVQRAAMWLLDQPPHKRLSADDVLKRIASADDELRRASLTLLAKHSEWAGRSIDLIRKNLSAKEDSPDDARLVETLLTAFEHDEQVQELIAAALRAGNPNARRAQVLAWMATSRLRKPPRSWLEALKAALTDPDPALIRRAVQTIGVLRLAQFDAELSAITGNESLENETRLEALRAALARRPKLDDRGFRLLAGELAADKTPVKRLAAAETLGIATLSKSQAQWLLTEVSDDLLVWPVLLPAVARVGDAEIGRGLAALVDRLLARDALQLSREQLRALFAAYPEEVRNLANSLFEKTRPQSDSKQLINRYREFLTEGDAVRGRAVFAGSQVACLACHRVAGEGGIVGPDLSKIGAVRSGLDLIESLVAPSASIAQGYQSFEVLTTDGRTATGVLAGGVGDQHEVALRGGVLVLRDSAGKQSRFAADEIEQVRRSAISMMPQGLLGKLSDKEVRDLLAYLQGLR